MKKVITIILLFTISTIGVAQNVYYVSTTGDDGNSGLSETNAWRTIAFAASSASPVSPGDTVFIKAGDYGNEYVIFEKDGTATNRITFEGYQFVPGDNPDLDWEYGDPLDASVMPLLDGSDRTTGKCLLLSNRKYIIIKNIQIKNYEFGLKAEDADNIGIDNIITMNFGDINDRYNGFGIVFDSLSSNNTIENCSVLNAAAEGISIYGDNNYLKNCRVYADDNSTGDKSAADYYIHVGGNNNTLEDCYVERIGDLEHGGHGIDLKGNCENNLILNCVSKGMKYEGYELRHSGVKYNTLDSCTAINCGYTIRDGASYNTIKNCKTIDASYSAILFYYTDEDSSVQYTGRHNRFENCIFQNTQGNVINFTFYELPSIADSNTFVNCVFDGGNYLFVCDRENNANKMINCIVTNVQNYYTTAYDQPIEYPLNFEFEYSDFWNNGFDAPTGNNVFTFNPAFVDLPNFDYHLTETSPCIDAGTSEGAPLTDFDGNTRPIGNGWDIGAYEYLGKILLQVKIFLEGAYNSNTGEMTTDINGQLPLTSPYSEDARAVNSIPANIVDWVLVQLRETATGSAITSRSAFLRKDGRIVADDGTTEEIELSVPEGNYFIVIKHRNHLAVMSMNAIPLNSTTSTLYDFTASESQFYGSGGAVQLESGVWGMWSGDADGSGVVDAGDRNSTWNDRNKSGYENSDVDLSGVVDAADRNTTWNNRNKSSTLP